MAWTAVSGAGSNGANEDLVVVRVHGGTTDILVLDGATSVAGRGYVDADGGDVAWFVHAFAAALEPHLDAYTPQDAAVAAAVDAVGAGYARLGAAAAAPPHAWPIAALTWIRIQQDQARLFCLGDCKTLLRLADGTVRDLDPWINPQEAVLQRVLAALPADPAERKARLLPLLRARREEQNLAAAPSVLCLRPAGPFAARRIVLQLAPGACLLGMTDGFYRLADPYAMYTPAALFDACLARGLDAMLAELRAAERGGGAAGLSVKAADDASAVLWSAAPTISHNPKEHAWTTQAARP
ncbi:protein phosphatase 2C domain-containing protein [Herbaspirillum sp. SJZ107]|uniref:protein phosphatase 2C domain-containing protein n=1 Tax=Herbaspirillum sp. SJZ107 TaxID=2572881 RepID=UPI0011527064|nr:protein phosphatase 2C domain-containing protein [Herbaspirillum sp. SJZ107]TQK11739.1 protein phosphatase 2C-like protein [Herbaspirillum sp. SJZ107]